MTRGFFAAGAPWMALLILICTPGRAPGATGIAHEEGQPFVRTFLPRDYRGGSQCWDIAQDARGIMYIGNEGCVLEYDGATWRKIAVTAEETPVFAVEFEPATGRVYVGASNEVGYLDLVAGGERVFVSLRNELPAEAREVGDVRSVFTTPQGVFFASGSVVLRWREGHFKVWKDFGPGAIQCGFAAGHLYVQSTGAGLLRLDGDTFVATSDDPVFKKTLVLAMAPGPDGSVLAGTLDQGLFVVRDGAVTPFVEECQAFFQENGVISLLPLRDGSTAVGLLKEGVVVIGRDGHFRNRLDESGGLPPGSVLGLGADAEGGLWVGSQIGVVRAEVNSPFSLLRIPGPKSILPEFTGLATFGGITYLSSAAGLFRVVPADPSGAIGMHLEKIAGSVNDYSDLRGVENGLLAAGMQGVVFLDPAGQVTPVAADHTVPLLRLCPSYLSSGKIYAGGLGRVRVQRLDPATGRWSDGGKVAALDTPEPIFSMVNTGRDDLWLATARKGLFRVRLAADGQPPVVTTLRKEAGPLKDEPWTTIASADGRPLLIATRSRLYRFDEMTQGFRTADEYGGWLTDGSFSFDAAKQAADGSLWWAGHLRADPAAQQVYGRVTPGSAGGAPVFQHLPHQITEEIGVVGAFLPREGPEGGLTGTWVAGSYGLVSVDMARWTAERAPGFSTLIRRAVALGEGEPQSRLSPLSTEPYSRNSLHFEFAANTYSGSAALRFQTRLRGSERGDWSDFGAGTSIDYLDLREGNYVFEVRARDLDGRLGDVASVAFRILPPWQRTLWAYALYALTFLLLIAALGWWRGRTLRHRNAALEKLVDARTNELKGREADLVRARDDAETANRAKSAFLANMSHELRTPLNAILGYSQILLGNSALPVRSREQIAVIDQSGEHLLSLINEVLDIAKVEAGKLTLNDSTFSLDSMLDEVGAAFRPRLAEKGLAFHDERPPGLPAFVRTDRDRLRQVLLNLLSNAVKFTRQGSVGLEVSSRGEAGAQTLRFVVVDTGVGIPASELTNIFEAFHQVSDRSLASQGTGLGLAISRQLVKLLGGTLRAESIPGQGSRFWFDLPLADAAPPPAARDPDDPPGTQAVVTGYQGARRRLLIVDDQAENRRVLRDLLDPLGFELDEAADGLACLEECARELPHAVLLDLRLGQPDGFEVARTLRKRTAAGAHLVVIALSASVFESDRQQALEAGCDDFLPKPFRTGQILAVLGWLLTLQWVYAEASAQAQDGRDENAASHLSTAELDGLLEPSGRGDVIGVRKQLEAWQADESKPGRAALARQLMPLVASYQVDELHARLLDLKKHHD